MIGINFGDVREQYCTLNQDGEVVNRGHFLTTPESDREVIHRCPTRAGCDGGWIHSIWISAQLQEPGCEVIVANVRELRVILHSVRKRKRFRRSRDVGCYLGLQSRRSQSRNHDPQLRITRAGNAYLQSLLIECSNRLTQAGSEATSSVPRLNRSIASPCASCGVGLAGQLPRP
jgi:hypothetical protein